MRRAAGIVVTWSLWVSVCFANGPEIGFDAGTIFPMRSRTIQLVSEKVDIDLPGENYSTIYKLKHNASCRYVLRNLSDSTQTFPMAFVSTPTWGDTDTTGEAYYLYRNNAYEVRQDGQPREVGFYRARRGELSLSAYGSDQVFFPTWALTIGPRATSIVEIRYNASWSGGCDGDNCGSDFSYITRPAALWARRIETAEFHLHIPNRTFLRNIRRSGESWEVTIKPSPYQWTSDGLQWKFHDWEPDSDLAVHVDFHAWDMGGDRSWDPWSPDSVALLPPLTTDIDRAPQPLENQACEDLRPQVTPSSHGAWPELVNHFRVRVSEEGTVQEVRYLDPPDQYTMYDGPEKCVRRWHFQPATRRGKTVAAWTDVAVRFPAISEK